MSLLATWLIVACVAAPPAPSLPEIATGYVEKPLVRGERWMIVAAHPLAAEAGRAMLRAGGSAIDAAIAAQLVLGLVEPQSSGLGGGGFMLHLDAATGRIAAWDGRETAPAASLAEDLIRIGPEDPRPPRPSLRASGRSIGVPGLMPMLEAAHREGGRLPWARLFEPAVRIADEGFAVTPRLHASLRANARELRRDPETREQFLDSSGEPLAVGARMRWPTLAPTLRRLAAAGATALQRGPLAEQVVAEVADGAGGRTPGRMTLSDLAAYKPLRRDALCTPFRRHVVCGMPAPSGGGIAVAQVLGIVEAGGPAGVALGLDSATARSGLPAADLLHLLAEAQRLAFADRDRYVADPAFAPLPGGSAAALLDPAYLARRAALIDPKRSLGTAPAGEPLPGLHAGASVAVPEQGTSHLTVVDASGNVVSLTSSIESAFGAFAMTAGGVLLNNQLTDFSAPPVDAAGRPVANRLEPGKRPRSSMAPTLVFERSADGGRGRWLLATGSPGGAAIIPFVSLHLIALLDWRLDARAAMALPAFGRFNTPTTWFGAEHPAFAASAPGLNAPWADALRARGHELRTVGLPSGLATIVRRHDADGRTWLEGAADPRREDRALAD
jgi:gamma-glutamyltranspeptidase/glutathione hydrolase